MASSTGFEEVNNMTARKETPRKLLDDVSDTNPNEDDTPTDLTRTGSERDRASEILNKKSLEKEPKSDLSNLKEQGKLSNHSGREEEESLSET